jgi:hypothetical protein
MEIYINEISHTKQAKDEPNTYKLHCWEANIKTAEGQNDTPNFLISSTKLT